LPSGPDEPNGGESHLTPMRMTPASLIALGSGGRAWAEAGVAWDAMATATPRDAMAHRSILMCRFMVDVPLVFDLRFSNVAHSYACCCGTLWPAENLLS
jgi:hypothetical protein